MMSQCGRLGSRPCVKGKEVDEVSEVSHANGLIRRNNEHNRKQIKSQCDDENSIIPELPGELSTKGQKCKKCKNAKMKYSTVPLFSKQQPSLMFDHGGIFDEL